MTHGLAMGQRLRTEHRNTLVRGQANSNPSALTSVRTSAFAAAVVMLLGEGLCFVILHFVVPMWTNFLDKNFSPTPEDVDRIVSSRFGVVVVLLVLLPWVFFYLLTFLTAVFTGEMASLVTNQRRVQSTALVVTMAVAAAAGPAAIAWVVTGRLYPDANSVGAAGPAFFAQQRVSAVGRAVRGHVRPAEWESRSDSGSSGCFRNMSVGDRRRYRRDRRDQA